MASYSANQRAIAHARQLIEARGKVTEWEGRLAEVESTYYPKLIGLTYVAPLYKLTFTGEPFNSPAVSHLDQADLLRVAQRDNVARVGQFVDQLLRRDQPAIGPDLPASGVGGVPKEFERDVE